MARQLKSDVAGLNAGGRVAAGNDAAAGAAADVFYFDPAAVARGIVFHLIDEGIAADVSADSVHRTIERLESTGVRPSVYKGLWAEMSHRERLAWLLAESHTGHAVLFGRTAVLTAAQN